MSNALNFVTNHNIFQLHHAMIFSSIPDYKKSLMAEWLDQASY